MKNMILGLAVLAMAACNTTTTVKENSDTTTVKTETATTTVQGSSSKDVVAHYLHVKNALAKDDAADAANGGNALMQAFTSYDQTALTEEQKKTFVDISAAAKEHAEHIAKNAGKIEHQREHFAMLSKDMYDFVKAMGAGQTLYQDHCPMYNNNKGANWLSETKEISNPYLGKKMPDCGTVKETLQ